MIEALITAGIILFIIGFICLITDISGWAFFFGTMGTYLLSGGILMYQESFEPTAIDVYKGKTTLEITYKDGVPIDSVVVFKDRENDTRR